MTSKLDNGEWDGMATKVDITSLKSKIEHLAGLINLPPSDYPEYELPLIPTYDFDNYVVIKGDHYLFYCGEPMGIFLYIKTESLDDLLYFLFESLTHDMANAMSTKSYQPKVEVRRFIWPKQLKLMKTLSPIWGHRFATTISEILAKHPPRDGMGDIVEQIQLETYFENNG